MLSGPSHLSAISIESEFGGLPEAVVTWTDPFHGNTADAKASLFLR